MNKKRAVGEWVVVFTVTLLTTALVTFLWNQIGHGIRAVDWEISFSLAVTSGLTLIWARSRAMTRK